MEIKDTKNKTLEALAETMWHMRVYITGCLRRHQFPSHDYMLGYYAVKDRYIALKKGLYIQESVI